MHWLRFGTVIVKDNCHRLFWITLYSSASWKYWVVKTNSRHCVVYVQRVLMNNGRTSIL